MATGPTQNYGDDAGRTWRPRPALALLVRGTAALGPVLFALAVGAVASHWFPAERLGIPTVVWLLLVVGLSSAVLVLANRWLRRLVPLSAMLRLSLALPDHVPNRFDVARRTWSPAALQARSPAALQARSPAALQASSPDALDASGRTDAGSAEWLLDLVSTLAAHDAHTRAHGERVQAYAALIGREMGLPREDVDRLSWVALLHDVGKVHVPAEVINKKGRPTEQEWASLQAHPEHGGRLVEPLRPWLGAWLDGVEQHHERWDGGGYPLGLAGTDVSLAARVIAVADTYDVITSARSYKKPMSAEQARAEITRCAGAQFDPEVVRAFLSVGIGRLRVIAGPATLLAALPWVGSVPAQALSTASSVAQTAGGQVATVLLATGVGVGSSLTATAALADPPATTSVAQSVAATGSPRTPAPTASGPRRTAASPRLPMPTGTPVPLSAQVPTAAPTGGVTPTAPPSTPVTTPSTTSPTSSGSTLTASVPVPTAAGRTSTGTSATAPTTRRTAEPATTPAAPVAVPTTAPAKPGKPVDAAKPEKTGKPEKPTKPEQPTKPEKTEPAPTEKATPPAKVVPDPPLPTVKVELPKPGKVVVPKIPVPAITIVVPKLPQATAAVKSVPPVIPTPPAKPAAPAAAPSSAPPTAG